MTQQTYAIGDVQGCFDELQALLANIQFQPEKDHLWLVGDLVNRGPKSLEVLRFVKNLPNAKVVLGNHDIHLLAKACGFRPLKKEDSLQPIIDAPDCDELLNWLRHQPVLHHDPTLGHVMTHAGIFPQWDLAEAKACAAELEAVLRGDDYVQAIPHLYGDEPHQWSQNLTGWDRLRFIINAFMRMRFCDAQGELDFEFNEAPGTQPKGYIPWYECPDRKIGNVNIVFGHWAALEGKTSASNVHAIDTGCVWGRTLTAIRLEDGMRFFVPAHLVQT